MGFYKKNDDLISVIVVTYNRLDYLKLTIDSILSQSYTNLEVLVVGDGDQPEVKDHIMNLSDPRISYLYVNHCGYPAKGRNFGVRNSSGSFIAFCDDDDIWAPYKLEKQIAVFNENAILALSCTNREIIDSNGRVSARKSLNWTPKKCNLSTLLVTNYISYSSVMIKRAILEKAGEFIDDIRFRAVEDYHLWIRIAYFGEVSFLDETQVFYRVHDTNITTKLSKGAKKNIMLFNDLFKKYKFSYLEKLRAYFVAYCKVFVYVLRNK